MGGVKYYMRKTAGKIATKKIGNSCRGDAARKGKKQGQLQGNRQGQGQEESKQIIFGLFPSPGQDEIGAIQSCRSHLPVLQGKADRLFY